MPDSKYLIIGGGMTAAAAVEGIRQGDPSGSVHLIGAEPDPPYDRPPLTKGLWKGEPLEGIWRRIEEREVTLHLGRTVRALDPGGKHARDDQGTAYTFDKLLLATGGTPRRLPFGGDQILYFRTLGDYQHLRALTAHGRRFAVIGGGFIGSELAAEHPSLARVFDRLGLDYCCRGRMPLDRACADARLDLDEVLHELDASADPEVGPGPDAQSGPALGPLIDRIVELHGRLRSELSQLAELAGRVASAHGIRDPKLRGVAHELGEFRAELESHLDREESSLFPILRQLDAARDQPAGSECRLGDPIRVPEREHWTAAAALGRLRVLTNDYTAPADACASYRTLLEGLARLDADLRRSIHEESNILYPKACATGSTPPDREGRLPTRG